MIRKICAPERFLRKFFPLEVHCWGGLGSQLFAWAVIEELLMSNYSDRLKLVLHTSGVTERSSEIDFLSSYVQIEQIHDFKLKHSGNVVQPSMLQLLLVKFVSKFKFVIKTDDIGAIFPWTFQLRGHYSRRPIPTSVILAMMNRFSDLEVIDIPEEVSDRTAVHYRLGDLLTLDDKSFVDPATVSEALRICRPEDKIDLFSDSPTIAIQKLFGVSDGMNFEVKGGSSWETLNMLLGYRNLVITNSKLGIWALIFRSLRSDLTTLYPAQISKQVQINLNSNINGRSILAYGKDINS